MTHRISHRQARLAALVSGALAVLLAALALATSMASASPFCGGRVVSNYSFCYGAERTMTGDTGYGLEHSVCVGIAPISGNCSGGPRQIATFNWGSPIYSRPYIQDNAAGSTVVWGETF